MNLDLIQGRFQDIQQSLERLEQIRALPPSVLHAPGPFGWPAGLHSGYRRIAL